MLAWDAIQHVKPLVPYASGTYANVFKACHGDVDVAIRVQKPAFQGSRQGVETLRKDKEMRMAAWNGINTLQSLHHHNIVSVLAVVVVPLTKMPALVMRWYPHTLRQLMGMPSVSIRKMCSLFIQVAGAVQYMHAQFMLHRDLKPANILVNKDFNHAAVCDLDQAICLGDQPYCQDYSGMPGGTPMYNAPERVRGAYNTPLEGLLHPINAKINRSDIVQKAMIRDGCHESITRVQASGLVDVACRCINVQALCRPTAGDLASQVKDIIF